MNRTQHLGAVGLVVAVGLAAASWAASASATGSRPAADSARASSMIAFVSTPRFGGGPQSKNELSVVNADGSRQRILTPNAWLAAPAWSPDGRRIAFVGHGGPSYDVYVMNADGSGQRRLTRNPAHNYSPAWSPDGRKIAFESRP